VNQCECLTRFKGNENVLVADVLEKKDKAQIQPSDYAKSTEMPHEIAYFEFPAKSPKAALVW
jgi:hypothetical protein